MADSSSTTESRVSARHHARSRAPKPALAAASRRPETVAAAVARGSTATLAAECEPIPDVPPGFKNADTNPTWMALKRKADEGFLHPNNKKAKNEDASSDEEEEYPPKFSDFDWLRPVSFVPPTKLPPLQIENSIFDSPDYSV